MRRSRSTEELRRRASFLLHPRRPHPGRRGCGELRAGSPRRRALPTRCPLQASSFPSGLLPRQRSLRPQRRVEQLLEIYDKLNELIQEVEKLGYKEPDEGSWHHSERLALAYGLISGAVPSGKVLRIVKNLRICAHCHEFFKYASMAIDRVIVVRDVNRYHTIKKGACSCRDYW